MNKIITEGLERTITALEETKNELLQGVYTDNSDYGTIVYTPVGINYCDERIKRAEAALKSAKCNGDDKYYKIILGKAWVGRKDQIESLNVIITDKETALALDDSKVEEGFTVVSNESPLGKGILTAIENKTLYFTYTTEAGEFVCGITGAFSVDSTKAKTK